MDSAVAAHQAANEKLRAKKQRLKVGAWFDPHELTACLHTPLRRSNVFACVLLCVCAGVSNLPTLVLALS